MKKDLLMLQLYKHTDGSMPSIDWASCGLSHIRNKGKVTIPTKLKEIKTKLIYNRKKLLDNYCLNGCNNWNILHPDYLDDFLQDFQNKDAQIQEQLSEITSNYQTIRTKHRADLMNVLGSQNLTQPQLEYAVEYLTEKTLPQLAVITSWGYTMFPPLPINDYLNICPSGKPFVNDLLDQTSKGMIDELFTLTGTILHAYQVREINGKYIHTMVVNIDKLKKYIPYLTNIPNISDDLKDLVTFTNNINELSESKVKSKLLTVKKTWARYLSQTNLNTAGEKRLLTAIIPTIPNPGNRHLSYWGNPDQKAKYLAQLNDYI